MTIRKPQYGPTNLVFKLALTVLTALGVAGCKGGSSGGGPGAGGAPQPPAYPVVQQSKITANYLYSTGAASVEFKLVPKDAQGNPFDMSPDSVWKPQLILTCASCALIPMRTITAEAFTYHAASGSEPSFWTATITFSDVGNTNVMLSYVAKTEKLTEWSQLYNGITIPQEAVSGNTVTLEPRAECVGPRDANGLLAVVDMGTYADTIRDQNDIVVGYHMRGELTVCTQDEILALAANPELLIDGARVADYNGLPAYLVPKKLILEHDLDFTEYFANGGAYYPLADGTISLTFDYQSHVIKGFNPAAGRPFLPFYAGRANWPSGSD